MAQSSLLTRVLFLPHFMRAGKTHIPKCTAGAPATTAEARKAAATDTNTESPAVQQQRLQFKMRRNPGGGGARERNGGFPLARSTRRSTRGAQRPTSA